MYPISLSRGRAVEGFTFWLKHATPKFSPLLLSSHGLSNFRHKASPAWKSLIGRPVSLLQRLPLTRRVVHLSLRQSSGKSKTHYEVLGLGRNATSDDIRAAFLKRSKESHPDMNRSNPDNHQLFVQVNEAYSVLSRPQSRKHYDVTLNDNRSARSGHYYNHPRDSPEEWLRQSGLREEYFRQNSQHHGKAGLNKISNVHIVAFCMLFMSVGIILHFLVVKRSSDRHIQNLNDRDLRTHELWMNAKRAAKEFTPRELTQHMLDKQEQKAEPPRG